MIDAAADGFDTFIVGSSNKFAHAACLAVATNPSHAYNPLFLYGNSGLGKTHLLYAIGNEIKKNDPSKVICYIKGDDFFGAFAGVRNSILNFVPKISSNPSLRSDI